MEPVVNVEDGGSDSSIMWGARGRATKGDEPGSENVEDGGCWGVNLFFFVGLCNTRERERECQSKQQEAGREASCFLLLGKKKKINGNKPVKEKAFDQTVDTLLVSGG